MINQGSFDLNTDEPNPSPHRQSLVKRLFIYRYRYTIERSSAARQKYLSSSSKGKMEGLIQKTG